MSLYAAFEVVLLHFWSYRELAILSMTSHSMKQVVSQVVAARIKGYLRLWLSPHLSFWPALEELKGVIGGAFVLRVLAQGSPGWLPRSLDIYLVGDASCVAMKEVLEQHGYTNWSVRDCRRQPRHTVIGDRFVWSKGTIVDAIYEANLGPRVVRLYSIDHVDALSAIPHHWSTLFINAIMTDRLLCAYPRTTLIQEGLISPGSWKSVFFPGLRQCVVSGFRIHGWDGDGSDGTRVGIRHGYRADDLRSLGDGKTLCLRVDASNLRDSPVSNTFGDSRARLVSWQYGACSPAYMGGYVPQVQILEPRRHGERYALRQEWLDGDWD
ncbi:uncharacterized protein STEHIDRAFT_163039 [Stereum hirsutum FP-91666 SS1]|uniref:Uncharacterized protein n=1 Tax=Stereum hirsutum (strain FP-91666) TaxID=721885 RepID=R7RZ15_STEHR|nr:uncharacterized protein STEHIDRAFT_163039 [Stereum hirsutum FP-91666 SS1]EIM80165.1 hypothetical protein STEHIDRAFT_163039 [Stereum hirsutum FP-91666 SS1]